MKTPKMRLDEIQEFRAKNSSSEVRRPQSRGGTVSNYNSQISKANENTKEQVRDILIKKIREFRDLV